MRFAELLDAVEELPVEERTELVEIVRRRLVEQRREEISMEIQEARRAFQAGDCQPMTADEILREIS